jgi:hypothetical protein
MHAILFHLFLGDCGVWFLRQQLGIRVPPPGHSSSATNFPNFQKRRAFVSTLFVNWDRREDGRDEEIFEFGSFRGVTKFTNNEDAIYGCCFINSGHCIQ